MIKKLITELKIFFVKAEVENVNMTEDESDSEISKLNFLGY